MKRIKLLAVLASAIVAIGFSSFQVKASTDTVPQNFGYKEVEWEVDRIYTDEEMEKLSATASVPAKYDSREHGNVTGIRNQNPYGTCWSFSTMAALEGSVLSKKLAKDIDLSEYHLLNYNYQFVTDPLGGTAGDDIYFDGSMADFLDSGGNVLIAYHALTNWLGATNDTGYVQNANYVMPKTVESAYLNDVIHMEQFRVMSKYDTLAVKQAIMDNGVITCSYYHDDYFMNYSTGAFYNWYNKGSNHAVAIVGWDDNYSKYNFLDTPSQNGAWLVKNSWGTWFGNDGFFWISYEDTSLQEAMCVLVAGKADNYDHNYQYDGSYYNGGYGWAGLTRAANVFQVPSNAKKEVLEAISFETYSANVDYEVQIYKNPTKSTDPTSGTAMLKTPAKGKADFQGFYTVKLAEKIALNPGDKFSVVVTLKGKSSEYIYMMTETSYMWYDTEFIASAKPGQSFMGNASSWMDYGAEANANVRIKAFTSDYVDPEPGNIFSDVPMKEWYYPYVKEAYDNGYMNGTGSDAFGKIIFKPLVNIPREQFVTVLFALEGIDSNSIQYTGKFSDVKSTDWFAKPVEWAAQNGIVSGIGNGKFGVGKEITREQMALMLYGYAKYKGYDVSITASIKDYPDVKDVSDWAYDAMRWAIQNGIMSGQKAGDKIYLKPKDNASRAVCATMIVAFAKKY